MIGSAPEGVRVLVVMPLGEQRGGAELMLVHLLQHAAEVGLTPTVAFLEDGPLVGWCRERGIAAHVLPAGRLRQPVRYVRTVRALARLARDADVVLGWMGKAHLYGGPAAVLARTPRTWLQAGVARPGSKLDRLIHAVPADVVITLSAEGEASERALRPRREVRRISPAVDLERFDPAALPPRAALRATLGLPADAPLYGTIGRLQRWKGFHVLVEALPHVLAERPDARCVLVGGAHPSEPEYGPELRALAADLGVADRVVFVDTHQTNPHEWIAALDVFVHAADGEPFGMVIIEAMALGRPVVASANGGPTEIVTPGVDGLLVPYGDAAGQAAAVLSVLTDTAVREQLEAAGPLRARDFASGAYARRVADILRDLT